MKYQGLDNDLLQRLAEDRRIPFTLEELSALTDSTLQYTGRAPQQTEEFLSEIVYPLLAANKDLISSVESALNV